MNPAALAKLSVIALAFGLFIALVERTQPGAADTSELASHGIPTSAKVTDTRFDAIEYTFEVGTKLYRGTAKLTPSEHKAAALGQEIPIHYLERDPGVSAYDATLLDDKRLGVFVLAGIFAEPGLIGLGIAAVWAVKQRRALGGLP